MSGADKGRATAEAVASEVDGFIAYVDAERLRLYRRHLQTNVRRVSPLVIDLAVYGGSRLEDIAWELTPPAPWPWYDEREYRSMYAADGKASAGRMYRPRFPAAEAGRSKFATRRGMVVCAPEGGTDEIGFTVLAKRFEALAAIGGVALQTSSGFASLILNQPLPESMLTALPGRPVDDLVSHPALDGRGYVVEKAVPSRNRADLVVTFRTGLLPFEMPWGHPEGEIA